MSKSLAKGTVWVTGVSAAGKTTTAGNLKTWLEAAGYTNILLLDGEELRDKLDRVYGFTPEERFEVIKNIVRIAKKFEDEGNLVIVSTISHKLETRSYARENLTKFFELYLKCSPSVCADRDTKGHYERALRGEYDCFVGITEPYEESSNPEASVDTSEFSPKEVVELIGPKIEEHFRSIPKAIIIAAGIGSRLLPYTQEVPKCLVEADGKSLLNHQIDSYRSAGIENFGIIKGYLGDKIDSSGMTEYWNHNFSTNNVLASLMCAKEGLRSGFIASYCDIVFAPSVVTSLLESSGDITCVIDTDWETAYSGRSYHPVSEAEKVVVSSDGLLLHAGKSLPSGLSPTGEFIGMLKCTSKGACQLIGAYEEAMTKYAGKPFIGAKTFDQAYLTDIFQYLADKGVAINVVTIQGGWREIDTQEDLDRVHKTVKMQSGLILGF